MIIIRGATSMSQIVSLRTVATLIHFGIDVKEPT